MTRNGKRIVIGDGSSEYAMGGKTSAGSGEIIWRYKQNPIIPGGTCSLRPTASSTGAVVLLMKSLKISVSAAMIKHGK